MKYRKSILAASIAASLYAGAVAHAGDAATVQGADSRPATMQTPDASSAAADAQTTPSNKSRDPEELGTVTVIGIRDSEAASLALKKDADTHVEVVTAEDIGKLPAKNVADTLARLPGVNIADAAGAEGGF